MTPKSRKIIIDKLKRAIDKMSDRELEEIVDRIVEYLGRGVSEAA